MTVLWEHLGMLDNLAYRRKWETKLAWYQANGITPMGDVVGPRGVLMTTDDTDGVDSEEWSKLARSVLLG
jgi:hypothetical protein